MGSAPRSRGSTKRCLLRVKGATHLKSTALGNRLARRLCYLLGSQRECFKNDEVVKEKSKTFCDLFWWGWSFATNWASFGLSNSRLLASCSFTVHCGDSWNVTVPNVLGVLLEHWMPTQPNQLHNCKSVFHKKEMLNTFLWINVGLLCCILGFLVGNSAISGCLQHPAHCVEKASGFYFPEPLRPSCWIASAATGHQLQKIRNFLKLNTTHIYQDKRGRTRCARAPHGVGRESDPNNISKRFWFSLGTIIGGTPLIWKSWTQPWWQEWMGNNSNQLIG